MARGVYTWHHDRVSSGTAVVTLIEFEHATAVIEIIRAWVHNTDVEVSEQWPINIVRKSADGTNVTTPIEFKHDPGTAASGATLRGMCTTVGTITDIYPQGANVLNGWEWIATDADAIFIAPAATAGLHLPVTRTAAVLSVGVTVQVHG